MHDAWGISDHAFVKWFIVVATIVVVVAMAYRFIAFRGRRVVSADVDVDHVAFLAGGPRLAVYSALGELRIAGVLGVGPDHILTRTAPLPIGASALQRTVYDAAGAPASARLSGHPAVADMLARIRDDLERTGLLLSSEQRAGTRWFAYAELAVVAIGAIRVAVGLANGTPVGDLLRAFVLVGLFMLFLVAVPRRTRAGAAVLAELRRSYVHLAPPRKPSLDTDGAGAAATSIGLFGVRSLYVLDPVFAADVGAPRPVRIVNLC